MKQLSTIPFADTTITLYNQVKIKNAGGKVFTKWFRTVIPNCYHKAGGITSSMGSISILDTKHVVKIPLFDKFYIPYDFSKLTNEERATAFTIATGDLIVLLEAPEIPDDFFIETDILTKYGSMAFKIANTTLNIGADKPTPHIVAIE